MKTLPTLASFVLYYEPLEKSPYYYKALYERRLKARQAQLDRVSARIAETYYFSLKALKIALLCLTWLIIQLIYWWTYVLISIMLLAEKYGKRILRRGSKIWIYKSLNRK